MDRENVRIMNKIEDIIAKGENRKGQVKTTVIWLEKGEISKGDDS